MVKLIRVGNSIRLKWVKTSLKSHLRVETHLDSTRGKIIRGKIFYIGFYIIGSTSPNGVSKPRPECHQKFT